MILTALILLMMLAFPAGAATGAAGEVGKDGLKVGDRAPKFDLEGSDGKTHSLADDLGHRPVVIAWFPKAFTSG